MIKKYLIFLLFLSCILCASDAQYWQSAIESYNAENYTAATTALLTIKNKNAAVFMVLSDCYLKINQPIIATMYQKKAFFSASWFQKWRLLEKIYFEKHGSVYYPIYQSMYDLLCSLVLSVPLLFYQVIFLLLFFFVLFFIKRRVFLRLLFGVILIFVTICGIWKYIVYQPHGILLVDTAIKNFPDKDAPDIAKLPKGSIVYYVKERNGFYRLQGPHGWIQIDDFGVILEI